MHGTVLGACPERICDCFAYNHGVEGDAVKVLFWIGIVVAALGVASLFVPIPHTERQGFSAGDFSVSMETKHSETIPPIASAALIVGGIGMIIAGKMSR
jgi:hypothetical protein